MLQTAKIMKKMNRNYGMGRIFLKECILLCLVRLPTSVAFPVGIKYPKSLPLAVLQTKKESELISKLLIRTLFAL